MILLAHQSDHADLEKHAFQRVPGMSIGMKRLRVDARFLSRRFFLTTGFGATPKLQKGLPEIDEAGCDVALGRFPCDGAILGIALQTREPEFGQKHPVLCGSPVQTH